MRYIMLVGLFTLLVPATIAAEKSSDSSPQQLAEYNQNLTGNAVKEQIELQGKLLASDSDYYAELRAAISNNDGEEWTVSYEGGYNPEIQFYDLNHDGVNDVFFQSKANKNDNLHHYHLHTLKDEQLQEEALPKQEFIKARFISDFKISIQIDYEQEPNIIDVQDESSDYVRAGIYNEQGKLTDSSSPVISPIAHYEPVEISEHKGYGLKSHQRISGASEADQLGTVETLWYYEKDKWIILKTEWVPAENKKGS